MNKRLPIYIVLGLILAAFAVSCNSSSSSSEEDVLSSNVAVTAFSLTSNDDVLNNLDSIHFTIDLDKAIIYNADSLPKGTKITKLPVTMTYATASSAQFHVTGGTVMKDSTFTYSSSDSIDFTGDVKFTIVSEDLKEKRTYTIKVNVHKLAPDSLYWNASSRRDLPTLTGNPTQQKTVQKGTDIYCLTLDAGSYVLATATAPDSKDWTKTTVKFPFNPNISTFTATDNAFYILGTDNELYSSADGSSWTDCGTSLYSISGTFGSRLLGVILQNGVYKHTEYPLSSGFTPYEVEDGFPVSGVSPMITLSSAWAVADQRLLIGGIDASGNYVGKAWGYDGSDWGLISTTTISGHKNMSMVAYYTYVTDTTTWKVKKYPTLLAMGGTLADGTNDKTVFVSNDNGVHWKKGGELLQLPDYIPAFSAAQAFVYNTTIYQSRSTTASDWSSFPSRNLPSWFTIAGASRATEPVTSWDSPYIYLFGGTNSDGTLNNSIWRGVINRLTFKPIY